MATDSGLKKKVGPLSVGGWVAVAGGGVAVLYYLRSRSAAKAAAAAATGTTGGGTIPTATGNSTIIGNGTGSQYASVSDYLSAIVPLISAAAQQQNPGKKQLDTAWAYTQATRWLMNGQCVGARGYRAIGAAINTAGLPPGASSPLTICTNSSGQSIPERTAIGNGQ